MKFSTLYGKSTNGKIKEWNISVLKMGDETCYIETEHGYQGGKKQLDSRYVGEGKNIGKSNETSPYEQACSEAKSSYNRKKDEGYAEDVSDIPKISDGMFLPMLAHRFDKHSSKVKYPAYVQPKLDGVRMLARLEADGTVSMWSRKGKVIDVPDKIRDELSICLKEGECVDGELYVHGWGFQRIIAAVKKRRDDTDLLEYHIYDSPHEKNNFEERFINSWHPRSFENTKTTGSRSYSDRIKVVETSLVQSEDELDALETSYIGDGYEGVMIRNEGSSYKYKHRSYDLQKVKRFEDDEFEIIGGKEGTGRESGMVVFKCLTKNGLNFDVRPMGSQEVRSKMFKNLNSYLGKMLTIRFQGLTDDGRPRFPVGVAVRDYE
tara:strand:- start:1127 stop:2257 length:1131 start_codon:yes stop_codon:yes gene_type:complete